MKTSTKDWRSTILEKRGRIKSYLPFIVVYVEEFKTKSEAIKRERYFKTSAGRRFLKKKLSENRIG